ncbi:MAG TPA: hypothetical protein DDY16_09725, partial [Tenacibaculum sp.]|nr:hypothetical protein [Tenacibaculum sp.]
EEDAVYDEWHAVEPVGIFEVVEIRCINNLHSTKSMQSNYFFFFLKIYAMMLKGFLHVFRKALIRIDTCQNFKKLKKLHYYFIYFFIFLLTNQE